MRSFDTLKIIFSSHNIGREVYPLKRFIPLCIGLIILVLTFTPEEVLSQKSEDNYDDEEGGGCCFCGLGIIPLLLLIGAGFALFKFFFARYRRTR